MAAIIYGSSVGCPYKKNPENQIDTRPIVEKQVLVVEKQVEIEAPVEKPVAGWKTKRKKSNLPNGIKEIAE